MRSRQRITWLVYAACVALVAVVLTVVSWQALRLEQQELRARNETRRQEAVRLALWRMDSRLTPILVREAARPYFQYRSFFPVERAYSRMWEPLEAGETLAPSPLLALGGADGDGEPDSGLILLHFQTEPDGSMTSPQAPRGEMLSLALGGYRAQKDIARAEGLLGRLGDLLKSAPYVRLDSSPEQDGERASALFDDTLSAQDFDDGSYASGAAREYRARQQAIELSQRNASLSQILPLSARKDSGEGGDDAALALRSVGVDESETFAKSEPEAAPASDGATELGLEEGFLAKTDARLKAPSPTLHLIVTDGADERVRLGIFEAVWIVGDHDPELVLTRQARIEGVLYRQGFWVDWPALSALLSSSVEDLLPNARLEPAVAGMDSPSAAPELLASVPIRLDPGELPVVVHAGLTAARGTLLLSWLALVGAAVAIGFVLRAAIQLSERRGRFVSAVTHELRTPLTTFRLYAQMLADGMVTDEDARREYLSTLKSESGRLSGIVENVLEYARLSRRRSGPEQTLEMTPEALLVRLRPMLSRRAEQSGMDLIVSADLDDATRRGITLTIDPQSVERILMNLVENACKYAGPAEGEDDDDIDPRIHLDVRVSGDQLEFLIADYGPGIRPRDRARIFGEFQRGAARPMRSGLGLGLALSRGLAREGGGELRLVRRRGHGAEFVLSLPIHAPPGGQARASEGGA